MAVGCVAHASSPAYLLYRQASSFLVWKWYYYTTLYPKLLIFLRSHIIELKGTSNTIHNICPTRRLSMHLFVYLFIRFRPASAVPPA
jgi:hypothetical protein